MKILALTDLSPLSKVGVTFAANLSVKFNAQMLLLNVLQIDQLTQTKAEFTSDEVIRKRVADRENECRQLLEQLKMETGGLLNAEFSVERGGPVEETVNTFARHHQCDLIVMGTKGASGIKKSIIGSNAAKIIHKSSIPVLTVPEYAVCKGLKDLVYASDLKNLSAEFALLLPLAQKFEATVQIIHIYHAGEAPSASSDSVAADLIREFNYPRINCHYIQAADVKGGIDIYLNGRNADVIAMFSGKRNFFERILEKSSTRDMVFQSTVPLLTFSR